MSNIKRFFSLALTAFFIVSAVVAPLAAQDSGGAAQRQLQIDINSIKDITGPDGREKRNKLLKDIGEAVAKGDTSDDIYAALEYISKEGLTNRTNNQGSMTNDYPDIREGAVKELGRMGTAKAADILILLCGNETVFDVQKNIIDALGNIGINENGRTVGGIFRIPLLQRYSARSTTDINFIRLANSAIDAFDKIDKKNNGLGNRAKEVQEFLDVISKKQFPRLGDLILHERAKKLLEELLRRESQRRQGG